MKNNIGLFITKRAQLSPKVDAVYDVTSGRRQTYVELNERCNRVANAMTDAGGCGLAPANPATSGSWLVLLGLLALLRRSRRLNRELGNCR